MSVTQRTITKLLLRSLIVLAMFALLGAAIMYWAFTQPIGISGKRAVFVAHGASVTESISAIHKECGLPWPWLATVAARFIARIDNRVVHSGWYLFHEGDTQWDVLQSLYTGSKRPTMRITLREGLTVRESAQILARELDVDYTAIVNIADSLEGYLFPNTYTMFWREEPRSIVDRLTAEFQKQTASLLPSYEQVVLASIVQAEAATESEMPRIAGVYVNRLQRGMKLEADPTVQYGLHMRGRVLHKHLRSEHLWNTYIHNGLPPTPICNPGLAAIKAAMNPEKHRYLYFVATAPGAGTHEFAASYGEHLINVERYRKARRADRR